VTYNTCIQPRVQIQNNKNQESNISSWKSNYKNTISKCHSSATEVLICFYSWSVNKCFLPTWQESGCAGPKQQCFHRCSRRSRLWRRGWWPRRSMPGPRMWALPWCGASERPDPRWSMCWPRLRQSMCGHQAAAYRSGCSYPCSVAQRTKQINICSGQRS